MGLTTSDGYNFTNITSSNIYNSSDLYWNGTSSTTNTTYTIVEKIFGVPVYELSNFIEKNKITLKNFKHYFTEKDGQLIIRPERLRAERAIDDLKR